MNRNLRTILGIAAIIIISALMGYYGANHKDGPLSFTAFVYYAIAVSMAAQVPTIKR